MPFPDISSVVTAVAGEIGASRSKTSPSAGLRFPSGDVYYGMYFSFKEMKYDLENDYKANFTQSISAPQIFLPMPVSGIIESLNMNYGAQEAGVLGQAVGAGEQIGGAAMSAYDGAGSGYQQAAAAARVAGTVGVAAHGVAAAVGIGAILDMQSEMVVNPYALTLFQSVAPRVHSFTWKLIPRSEQESKAIREIILEFQKHSLPTLKNSGTFLGLPDECELAFFGTQQLYKFARSVVTSVTVNHTPYGAPVFFGRDGSPVATELTLTFQEVQSLTRESYSGEFSA